MSSACATAPGAASSPSSRDVGGGQGGARAGSSDQHARAAMEGIGVSHFQEITASLCAAETHASFLTLTHHSLRARCRAGSSAPTCRTWLPARRCSSASALPPSRASASTRKTRRPSGTCPTRRSLSSWSPRPWSRARSGSFRSRRSAVRHPCPTLPGVSDPSAAYGLHSLCLSYSSMQPPQLHSQASSHSSPSSSSPRGAACLHYRQVTSSCSSFPPS